MNRNMTLKRVILLSQGGLLILALTLYIIFRRDAILSDLWNQMMPLPQVIYAGIMAGLGIRLFSMVIGGAWSQFQDGMEQTVIKVLQGIDNVDLLLISLPPAIVEELFFRGFLQPYLGIGITAFIFASLHWGFQRELWAHGLHAFIIGLFLGWLYLVTGSLLATIVAHFINNLLAGMYIQNRSVF